MPTIVSLIRRVFASVSVAPAEEAARRAGRSHFEKLALGGAALVALATGAVAQTASSTHTMDGSAAEHHMTTASGVTLDMDAGLSAVVLGGATDASNKTVTNNGTLTATVDTIEIKAGSGNTIGNSSTGRIESDLSAVSTGSLTTNTTVNNDGTLTGTGAAATIDIMGTTAGITNTGTVENTGTGEAIHLQKTLEGGASISNSGTVSALYNNAINIVGTIGGTGSGSISNTAGTITATGGNGIRAAAIASNGSMENIGTGTITALTTGYAAIRIAGDNAGTIDNASGASIISAGAGIYVAGNSTVINNSGSITAATSGSAVGETSGIYIAGDSAGDITDDTGTGTITASRGYGIYTVGAAGDVTGNTITSRLDGIHVGGTADSVASSGTITTSGTAADGVRIANTDAAATAVTGSVSVHNIVATGYGVNVNGAVGGSVMADGTINSVNDGIHVGGAVGSNVGDAALVITATGVASNGIDIDGSVTGTTSAGAIRAGNDGINISGAAGDITVATVVGSDGTAPAGGYGIYVGGDAGAVSATNVTSTDAGIYVGGTAASVTSTGTITTSGTAADGVHIANTGAAATAVTGSVSVHNIAATGYGVNVNGAVTGSVMADGTIVSVNDGIHVGGSVGGNVGDAGLIVTASGVASNGIDIDGSVTGTTSAGTIRAGNDGINISGSAGDITVATVVGSDGTAPAGGYGIYVGGDAGAISVMNVKSTTGAIYVGGDATSVAVSGGVSAAGTDADGIHIGGDLGGATSTITGAIGASGYGISVGGNLTSKLVIAETTGSITSTNDAIHIEGTKSGGIDNKGALTSSAGSGIAMDQGNSSAIVNFASGTISAHADGILVGVVGSAPVNNTGNIANSGTIASTTGNGIHVTGANGEASSNAAIIRNFGTITAAAGNGIRVDGDNRLTVVNEGSGTIGTAGVRVGGSGISVGGNNANGAFTAYIENSGEIYAEGDGLHLEGDNLGGRVLNAASGLIDALGNGIAVGGDNEGTISNEAGATITAGTTGISVGGANWNTVSNAGSIAATGDGVAVGGNNEGTISNEAGATITAGTTGISVGEANWDSVSNAGSIAATGEGIAVGGDNEGTISNEAGATITAGTTGISVGGANWNTVSNAGSIAAAGGDGIAAEDNNTGNITNGSTGEIYATDNGIAVGGNNASGGGTIANYGTIGSASAAVGQAGINVSGVNSGTIINYAGGTIYAEHAGISVGDAANGNNSGRITNSGQLIVSAHASATDANGIVIYGGNTGIIDNDAGTITVGANGNDGIHVTGSNSGTIRNATGATIAAGAAGIAVGGANTASIQNTTGASITAGTDGVAVGSTASGSQIVNSGATITATDGSGIRVTGANAGGISNVSGASISAGAAGIAVEGVNSGAITNSGSEITGGVHGILLAGGNAVGGDILNAGGSTAITATTGDAIHVTGANAAKIQSVGGATLTAAAGDGIHVTEANSSLIENHATITAAANAVFVGAGNSVDGKIHSSGSITATTGDGLHVTGANAGEVLNWGTLTATLGDGIEVTGDNTGTVANTNGGRLTAAQNGLLVGGSNSGTVSANNGTYTTATAGDGIQISGGNSVGGTVSVYGGATVTATAGDGIEIVGSNAGAISVIDGGSVTGATSGLTIGGSNIEGGEIVLRSGASIRATATAGDALHIGGSNAGTISNLGGGNITSDTGNGIVVENDNAATGTIRNQYMISAVAGTGIQVGSNAGEIENSGSIGTSSGRVGTGIQAVTGNSGTITNTADGALFATQAAILVGPSSGAGTADNTGEITNEGTLNSLRASGIQIIGANTKDASISNSGAISALIGATGVYGPYAFSGIQVGSNAGTIENSGTITADRYGIFVAGDNSGTITNTRTGRISSTQDWYYGIYIGGENSGTVSNANSLASAGAGIWVNSGNAGTIHNTATGEIDATDFGIRVYGSNVAGSAILNDGRVTTVSSDGLLVRGTNEGSIGNNGTIDAGEHGIEVSGEIDGSDDDTPVALVPANNAAITNNGTIEADGDGIRVAGPFVRSGGAKMMRMSSPAPAPSAPIDIPPTNGTDGVITNAKTIIAGGNGITVGDGSSGPTAKGMDADDAPAPTVANAGLVQNLAGASITSGEDGISLGGENASTGIVRNSGTITAGDNGIVVGSYAAARAAAQDGTSVTANSGLIENTSGATITAGDNGIYFYGDNAATGRVVNAGTIAAEESGILLAGYNLGEISNTGTIEDGPSGIGVWLDNSGRIANSGTITAAMGGIGIQGNNTVAGTIFTSGTITASSGLGVVVGGSNAGTITNTGAITAGLDGINVYGANTGTITSSNEAASIVATGNGISVGYQSMGPLGGDGDEEDEDGEDTPDEGSTEPLVHTGAVQNLAGSSITAGANGIYVLGINAGTALNAGAIEAEANGILVSHENTGSVVNAGTIEAGRNGIHVYGGLIEDEESSELPVANSGIIQNTGTIAANDGIFVQGNNTGNVFNAGTIEAEYIGILTGANSGLVQNTKSIVSDDSGIAIYGDNSGTVENLDGATISTDYDGIEIRGANTATGRVINAANASIVTVFPSIAVFGENAGLIQNSGSVSSERVSGIYVRNDNTGTIDNSGSLSVAEGDGIQLRGANAAGAAILNSGSIAATDNGISLGANAGRIVNSGSIGSAASPAGEVGIIVFDANSGSVLNSGAITAREGIAIVGDNTGTILNAVGGSIAATQDSGIVVLGDNAAEATIGNAGSIVAGTYGIIVEGSEGDEGAVLGGNNVGAISNSGTIAADRVGILVNGDSNVLANSGSISGRTAGVLVAGDVTGSITNSGTITSAEGVALQIDGDARNITNSGTLSCTSGLVVGGIVSGDVVNSGTIVVSDVGLSFGSIGTVTNSGTITATGAGSVGLYTQGTASVMNSGSVTANGTGSAAIVLAGATQTLVNSGTIASDNVAVASNGDDTIVMATGASVSGAIVSSGAGSTLCFGSGAAVVPGGDLLASGSSAFDMTYGGAVSNFNTVFLAGTTNFNGAGATGALNTSAILADATFRANRPVQFIATGALPAGIVLPTTTAPDVALYNMGTLGGAGMVSLRSASGGLGTLVNTGTIAPGNSIDTLTIDGNGYNTGTLAIELGASTCDLIQLTSGVPGSTATFTFASGSTVAFTGTGTTTYTPGDTFNFMKADSSAKIAIEGTPVSSYQLLPTTDTLADYKFYVVGDTESLSNLGALYAVVARDHAYSKFTTTASQSVVGTYLDGHRDDASFDELLLSLDFIPSDADLSAALGLMSGELYPSLVVLENERVGDLMKSVATALRPLGTAQTRVEPELFEPRWYAFAQASVDSSDASDGKVADLDTDNDSVLAGVGCQVYPKWDIGGFLNAGEGKVKNANPDKADITNTDFGFFGRYNNAGDYYYASVAYSSTSFETERQAAVTRSHPLVAQAAVRTKGEFDGKQFTVYLEKGYTFVIGKSTLQPYAAFQYAKGSYDRFSETGDGLLDLTVDFEDFTSMRGILGATWRYEINKTFGVAVRANWAHEFDDEVAYVAASFRGASNSYRLRGLEMGADRFNAGLDLSVRLTDRLSAWLRADFTTSDGQETESANIGVRYGW